PDVLPPCPLGCASGGALGAPVIAVGHLATPPGDDRLLLRADVGMTRPFDPPLDPVAVGLAVRVIDAGGVPVLDAIVPGGSYDRATQSGWLASPARGVWKYVNRSATPPSGITRVTIKDLRRDAVRVSVEGKRGAYPVDLAALPLTGLVVLDPPTAETGQC